MSGEETKTEITTLNSTGTISSTSSHPPDWIPEPSVVDPSLLQPLSTFGDENLYIFVEEYNKLQQALKKSHESEARFIVKCKSLQKQTRAHQHKYNALHTMHQAD